MLLTLTLTLVAADDAADDAAEAAFVIGRAHGVIGAFGPTCFGCIISANDSR